MSDNYILFTDSGADIPPSLLSEWGVGYQPLTFRFDHIDKEFSNDEMDIREFYRLMREGHIAKTSAVASAIFKDTFERQRHSVSGVFLRTVRHLQQRARSGGGCRCKVPRPQDRRG